MWGTPSPVRSAFFVVALVTVTACGGSSGPPEIAPLPCCNEDGPFCTCFVDAGDWDPAVDWLQDVALSTVGTAEYCQDIANDGKPYYQMRLGCNSVYEAQAYACMLDIVGPLPSYLVREAWCSEAVSYWHREAEIPYPMGYRNRAWLFDWRLPNTGALQTWYETEEASSGRGRWINWDDLDYANFQLGVNAPVPGAYVKIQNWDSRSGFGGNNHSMVVDEMFVYRINPSVVSRVRVTLVEGNSQNKVRVDREIADILDVTPWGTKDIFDDGRRIRGFGVDLDEFGGLVYDPGRLHYVDTTVAPPDPGPPPVVGDPMWEQFYAPLIPALAAYTRVVGPGPVVQSSVPGLAFTGIPDGQGLQWTIPADAGQIAPQGFDVTVDLMAVHPLPVEALVLRWGGAALPQGYGVQWADGRGVFQDAVVPTLSEREVPFGPDGLAAVGIPISLGQTSQAVRYLRFRFPPGALGGRTVLHELRILHDWGPSQDAEDP